MDNNILKIKFEEMKEQFEKLQFEEDMKNLKIVEIDDISYINKLEKELEDLKIEHKYLIEDYDRMRYLNEEKMDDLVFYETLLSIVRKKTTDTKMKLFLENAMKLGR